MKIMNAAKSGRKMSRIMAASHGGDPFTRVMPLHAVAEKGFLREGAASESKNKSIFHAIVHNRHYYLTLLRTAYGFDACAKPGSVTGTAGHAQRGHMLQVYRKSTGKREPECKTMAKHDGVEEGHVAGQRSEKPHRPGVNPL
jgi:hypothetical protein